MMDPRLQTELRRISSKRSHEMAQMAGIQHREPRQARTFDVVAARRLRASRRAAAELRRMAGLEPEVPSYGLRSGVPAPEIADTIEAIFSYFHDTKREYSTLVEAIDQEAVAWRGEVEWLRDADQATLDRFFGQPSRSDIGAALAARGVTKENTPPDSYQEQAQALFEKLET